MRFIKYAPILIVIFCAACSLKLVGEAETVRLDYWGREALEGMPKEEYVDDSNGLDTFVRAVDSAEELKDQKVITTKPLLSLEFIMESDENRNYHLWITDEGAGYFQSLAPHKNLTYQIDSESIEGLNEFFAMKENVDVLQEDIEFEQH